MHDVTVIKIFAFNDTEKCFQSSTEPNSSLKKHIYNKISPITQLALDESGYIPL